MFSPEFRLLLLACRIADAGAAADEAGRIIVENRIDWDDLYKRATFHCIEPQVSALLDLMPPSVVVPDDIRAELRSSVQANLVGQMRYVAEFFRIEGWLRSADITVIPYKGFWLGESAYGNLADRVSSDIDLFIRSGDLEEVRRIMQQEGYSGHESLEELTDEHIRAELAEYNFDRYEEGVCQAHVEFHWRSSMSFYRMGITLEDLDSQVMPGVLQGRSVKVFSAAANLLLVVMHHGGKECYIQLRQVLDIAHILRRHPDLDWAWLIRQAERFHVAGLLYLGVRLAHELTEVEVPAALAESARGFSDRRPGNPAGSERVSTTAGSLAEKRTGRMVSGRITLMGAPVKDLVTYRYRLASWLFKIRSRDGLATKAHLLKYTVMKVIAPRMVPEKWRHLFFSRKIRRNTAV